jgi:glucose/galactose transporter
MPTGKPSIAPIVILGILFFIFGFVTWLNGTLIPYLRIACELNTFQSLLVAFAFYISYFVTAIPSSWVLHRTGYKRGMMLGLGIMAVGALLFVPAALSRTYLIFLIGLFVIGTGLSLLQTASNPYITILGDLESAAARISIMGICNKVAGVLAPLILGALVLSDADQLTRELETLQGAQRIARLDELAHRAIVPYTFMAGMLLLLSLFVRFSGLPEMDDTSLTQSESTLPAPHTKRSVFSYPNLVLGVVAIFVYVGAEVIAGDTIGTYGQSIGIPLSEAKNFTAYTLSAMVIGYVVGIAAIPRWIRQERALAISAAVGILFSLLIQFTHGYASVLFIALLGLANALMWPAIWPLAIEGLGRFTKIGSALLIMGIAGGALLPLLYGRLADLPSIGPQHAYWILLPCYGFIFYYAWKGHRIRSW